jgi:hypothetical protein
MTARLLAILRWLWSPARWATRRFGKRAVDRQALVREGSRAVTHVIELVNTLGPGSILSGSDEHHSKRLRERESRWTRMRHELLRYANRHPSDPVRATAHELEQAVYADLATTAALLRKRNTEATMEATMDTYRASERAHRVALETAERLMVEIREY